MQPIIHWLSSLSGDICTICPWWIHQTVVLTNVYFGHSFIHFEIIGNRISCGIFTTLFQNNQHAISGILSYIIQVKWLLSGLMTKTTHLLGWHTHTYTHAFRFRELHTEVELWNHIKYQLDNIYVNAIDCLRIQMIKQKLLQTSDLSVKWLIWNESNKKPINLRLLYH